MQHQFSGGSARRLALLGAVPLYAVMVYFGFPVVHVLPALGFGLEPRSGGGLWKIVHFPPLGGFVLPGFGVRVKKKKI